MADTATQGQHSRPMHVHFAPLRIPLTRRLQTLAVLCHTLTLPYFVGFFFLMAAIPALWPLLLMYVLFMFFDNTQRNGRIAGRQSMLMRRLPWYKFFCDYFPIRIHREVALAPTFPDRPAVPSSVLERWIWSVFSFRDDAGAVPAAEAAAAAPAAPAEAAGAKEAADVADAADAKENADEALSYASGPRYIFGYHPHGIVSLGAFGAIGTEGADWEKLFPGIPVSLLTLASNFNLPIYKEYLLSLGIASVSRSSCLALLRHNQSICIVVGGAQEALLSQPGSPKLVIKRRKGFVRLAMEAGNTALVPILSFGENDVYMQVKNDSASTLWKMQTIFKRVFGFTLPLLHARGIFNYDFGLLPYRRPINLVVGKPIAVPYLPHPSEDDINKYHGLYVAELERLWHTHKDEYITDWTGEGKDKIELQLVE
ncbi:diacylglycerol acyltransferase-domain-containing protein [Dipodascopsis tothii]|uniref:diacylglycerol acyltransferase-domain-containing protein n=1 Tax=Dipodascopsis tothii TaxID=44089 RepID=UPI0034CE3E22